MGHNTVKFEIVLELKKEYVDAAAATPLSIFNFPKSWIFCEKQIQEIDEFAFKKTGTFIF
jgi:hypothetical protein